MKRRYEHMGVQRRACVLHTHTNTVLGRHIWQTTARDQNDFILPYYLKMTRVLIKTGLMITLTISPAKNVLIPQFTQKCGGD